MAFDEFVGDEGERGGFLEQDQQLARQDGKKMVRELGFGHDVHEVVFVHGYSCVLF